VTVRPPKEEPIVFAGLLRGRGSVNGKDGNGLCCELIVVFYCV